MGNFPNPKVSSDSVRAVLLFDIGPNAHGFGSNGLTIAQQLSRAGFHQAFIRDMGEGVGFRTDKIKPSRQSHGQGVLVRSR